MRCVKHYLLAISALSAIAVALIISTPVAAGPTPCSYPCLLNAEAEAELCAATFGPGPDLDSCLKDVQAELDDCLATSCRK